MPKKCKYHRDYNLKCLQYGFVMTNLNSNLGTIFNTPRNLSRASEVINDDPRVSRNVKPVSRSRVALLGGCGAPCKEVYSYFCLTASCRILVIVTAIAFGLCCLSSPRVPFYAIGMKIPTCTSSSGLTVYSDNCKRAGAGDYTYLANLGNSADN